MSFETFSFKRIEYKLKTICQLAERMGAINVKIDYLNTKHKSNNNSANINIPNNSVGFKNSKKTDYFSFGNAKLF